MDSRQCRPTEASGFLKGNEDHSTFKASCLNIGHAFIIMAGLKGNKNALGNKGGGRKSSFREEFISLAHDLALLGATDKDLAEALGTSEQTINNWKKAHLEFSLALKKGKLEADSKVAASLYKNALEGNTTAQIFWLKNRQSNQWREKQQLEHGGNVSHTLMDMIREAQEAG
ncbi:helix-turn-helix domain-containing protein [bacterium]|nr:helix-turn-helix domain-containing protein [bacterium]